MERLLIIFTLISLNGWGQSQPENVQIRPGTAATVDYVTNQMAWQRLYVEAEIKAIREAVEKVEVTNTNYRADANEWRGQSKDRESKYATRTEVWTAFVGVFMMMFGYLNYIKKTAETKSQAK